MPFCSIANCNKANFSAELHIKTTNLFFTYTGNKTIQPGDCKDYNISEGVITRYYPTKKS